MRKINQTHQTSVVARATKDWARVLGTGSCSKNSKIQVQRSNFHQILVPSTLCFIQHLFWTITVCNSKQSVLSLKTTWFLWLNVKIVFLLCSGVSLPECMSNTKQNGKWRFRSTTHILTAQQSFSSSPDLKKQTYGISKYIIFFQKHDYPWEAREATLTNIVKFLSQCNRG